MALSSYRATRGAVKNAFARLEASCHGAGPSAEAVACCCSNRSGGGSSGLYRTGLFSPSERSATFMRRLGHVPFSTTAFAVRGLQNSTGAGQHAGATTAQQQLQEGQQQAVNHTAQEIIAQARARVFEEHIGDGRRSGRQVLLQPLKGSWIKDYYYVPDAHLPFLENEQEADRLERVAQAKAAGKAPPKKGQGKRAKK